MRQHGYKNAANQTHRARDWYATSDYALIGSLDRIQYLLEKRKLLPDGVDFFVFPPVGTCRYQYMQLPMKVFQCILTRIKNVRI